MARNRYTYLKAYRADLARVGLCIDSCGREARPGRRRCARCAVRAQSYTPASPQRKAARGECINCPLRARPGHRRCQVCTAKLAERDARRALRRRYAGPDAAAKLDMLT